jgi:hypothetical protein
MWLLSTKQTCTCHRHFNSDLLEPGSCARGSCHCVSCDMALQCTNCKYRADVATSTTVYARPKPPFRMPATMHSSPWRCLTDYTRAAVSRANASPRRPDYPGWPTWRAGPSRTHSLCITAPPMTLWGKAMLSSADVLPCWAIAKRHQRAAAMVYPSKHHSLALRVLRG